MFERLMAWFTEGERDFSGEEDAAAQARQDRRVDGLQMAVAALLVEAANVDDQFKDSERATIRKLLERCFALAPDQARRLEAAAERRAESSAQIFGFTRTINERWSPEQRIELVEMLWEVAYADGELDALEDTMLRRVGGLVDVPDRERGEARRRVQQRLGIVAPD